jgi:hypothetical protein
VITGGRPDRADAAQRLSGKGVAKSACLTIGPGPFVSQSGGVTMPLADSPEALGCFAPGDAFLTGAPYVAAMAWSTVS